MKILILIGYKIANQFDEFLLKLQNESEYYKMNFDYLKIFKDIVNKKISFQSCIKLHKNE